VSELFSRIGSRRSPSLALHAPHQSKGVCNESQMKSRHVKLLSWTPRVHICVRSCTTLRRPRKLLSVISGILSGLKEFKKQMRIHHDSDLQWWRC
jgi:hypothetical protein